MNNKILSLLFASSLLLSACGGDDTDSIDDADTNDEVEEVTEDSEEKRN